MDVYQALKKMHELTEVSIPFSIEFFSYNSTKQISSGIKKVESILLRTNLRENQSYKSRTLIAYYNYKENKHGFFNLPLLIKLNNITINNGY